MSIMWDLTIGLQESRNIIPSVISNPSEPIFHPLIHCPNSSILNSDPRRADSCCCWSMIPFNWRRSNISIQIAYRRKCKCRLSAHCLTDLTAFSFLQHRKYAQKSPEEPRRAQKSRAVTAAEGDCLIKRGGLTTSLNLHLHPAGSILQILHQYHTTKLFRSGDLRFIL